MNSISPNIIYINSLLNRWLQAKHVTSKNKAWKKMNNYSQEQWRNHLAGGPKEISTELLRGCGLAGPRNTLKDGELSGPLRGHSHSLGLGIPYFSFSCSVLFLLVYSIFHLTMYPEMLVVLRDVSVFLLFWPRTPGIFSSFLDMFGVFGVCSGHSRCFLRQWRES